MSLLPSGTKKSHLRSKVNDHPLRNCAEVHKLLLSGSEDLLNGVCSAMCAKNNNPGGDGKQSCIGFSTNVTDDYTCKLYSDVAFAKSANRIASKEKLYQK